MNISKYQRLSAFLGIPSRDPKERVPSYAVGKEPSFPLRGERGATLDLARGM